MFAIGDKEWPGVSKAMEEMGELLQAFGKLMGIGGQTNHWSGNLMDMMHDESSDVLAAIWFFIHHNNMDINRILSRMNAKYAQYLEWQAGIHEPLPVDTTQKDS